MKLTNIKTEKKNPKAQYIEVVSSDNGFTTKLCVCYNSVIKNEKDTLKTLKAEVIASRIVTALKLLNEVENLPKGITKSDLLTKLKAYQK